MAELTAAHVQRALAVVRGESFGRPWWHLRDELESGALEALARAAMRFDPTRGGSLQTHLDIAVRRSVVDGLRAWGGRHGRKWAFGANADDIDLGALTMAVAVDDPAEQVCTRETLDLLFELPDREREAIVGDVEGRHQHQLATAWGVTDCRVSQILTTARAHLAALVDGIEDPPPRCRSCAQRRRYWHDEINVVPGPTINARLHWAAAGRPLCGAIAA